MTARDTASSGVVRSARWLTLLLLAFALLGTFATGCRKKSGPVVAEASSDPPAVTDATTDLLLTWIDDKGEFHVEQRVTGVPAAARDIVKVRDPARDPLTGDRIFVVDLRSAVSDGTYPVRVAANDEFEGVAVARRAKHGVVLAP